MEMQAKNNELKLSVLWKVLRTRFLFLLLALILGMGAAFCYTRFIAVPKYSSSADLMVENLGEGIQTMQTTYLQGAEIIAQNYSKKLNGNVFLEKVAKAYNDKHGKNLTFHDVGAKMTAIAQAETSIVRVTVSSTDPKEAYDLIQIVENLAVDELTGGEQFEKSMAVSVISRGLEDKVPDSPNLFLNLLIGSTVAFLLAYIACFLIIVLDRTIYTEQEIKEQFDLPIVGQVPEWLRTDEISTRKRKKTFRRETVNGKSTYRITRDYKDRLLSKDSPFWITEAFKTLRTNLTYSTTGDTKCPIFGITSDFTGAGKSLIAANLAISFAQLDKKVLLIDGDMRCPAQHRIFSTEKGTFGLSEALTGAAGDILEHYVAPSGYENLDLMVCGHLPPNPCELLASERMKRLLSEVSLHYDYVLVDLPPICATTDAGVLALSLTGYVLTVRAGYSNSNAVSDSIETMRAMHANIVGFVLNAVPPKSGARYGAYKNEYGSYTSYSRYGRYARFGLATTAERAAEETNETAQKTE